MSLFKQQLTAARAKRVEVDLQAEGSVATESLEADVSQEIDVDAIMDQFAEDREGLNALLTEGALESLGEGQTDEVAVESLETEQRDTSREDGVTQETSEEVSQEAEGAVEQTETTEVSQEAVQVEQVDNDGGTEVIVQEEQEVTQTEETNVSQEEVQVEQTATEEVTQEQAEVSQTEETVEQVEEIPAQEMPENEDLPADFIPAYNEDDEDDETVEAEMAVMQEVDSDMEMIENLGQEMMKIENSIVAIEAYGINPSAMAILQTTGLLSDTVLEAVGIESLGYAGPKSDETAIALEALSDKADGKKTSWAAKIVSMATTVGSKVMGVLGSIWNKITGVVKSVSGFAWDKVKAGAAIVKAHPYKTIIVIVAAIAATAGIAAFVGANLPATMSATGATGKGAEALVKFSESVASKVNAIKWPFGKVAAEVTEKGSMALTVTSNVAAPEATALAKTGWTATVFNGVSSALGRAWNGIKGSGEALSAGAAKFGKFAKNNAATSSFKDTWKTLNAAEAASSARVARIATAKGTGAGIAAAAGRTASAFAYFTIGASFIKLTYGLLFKVVAFGLRVIYGTMKAIANAVMGSKPAEA